MIVHLVDGTYELFRSYFGQRHDPKRVTPLSAAAGVVNTCLTMLEGGATHLGVATDHVIESFRNDLWSTYKTSAGIDAELLFQFTPLEDALDALGVAVWPMVELEADDALASAAAVATADARVDRAVIWTVDKDLGQCVGGKVQQYDRKSERFLDADAVEAKFGVPPASIPDYLALVGDSADGFPGLPGWGAKSTAAVLKRYGTIEAIPDDVAQWDVKPFPRNGGALADTLATSRNLVAIFKDLATLRTTADVGTVDDWAWEGPETGRFASWCKTAGWPRLADRAAKLAADRGF
jgi:5'-3' exonuclease